MTAWNPLLRDQFEWHWKHQLRSRLAGLSDEEYFWDPVQGAWSLRPRSTATSLMAAGAGDFTIDWAFPEPTPAPVTTIAWRLGHVIVGVLGMRNAAHFGRAPVDYTTFMVCRHRVRGAGPTGLWSRTVARRRPGAW